MKIKTIILLFFLFFSVYNVFSQNKITNNDRKELTSLYNSKKHKEYLHCWHKLNVKIPGSYTFRTELANVYFYLQKYDTVNLILDELLEDAKEMRDTAVLLIAGKAHYYTQDFSMAVKLIKFVSELKNDENDANSEKINRWLSKAINAKSLANYKLSVKNTPIAYNPKLGFTLNNLLLLPDNNEAIFSEQSTQHNLQYSAVLDSILLKNISNYSSNHLLKNHYISFISFDGTTMLASEKTKGQYNLVQLVKENGIWKKTENFKFVNTKKFDEKDAYMSADGKAVYFASNKEDGYGGFDIYVCKQLPNGIWAAPQNLGNNVNTGKNEISPFIYPDNSTLFFSSEGHTNMGGYDIFFSVNTFESTNSFTKAINIGYPINSIYNDIYFSTTVDTRTGFFTSNRIEFGKQNSFFITQFPENKATPYVVLKGMLKKQNTDSLIDYANITVLDNNTNDIIGYYNVNSNSKKFIIILKPKQSYMILIQADGFKEETIIYNAPESSELLEVEKSFMLTPDNDSSTD